ncbi:hypothetical protein V6N12_068533 [Hibiscus sabdariffa]|uniref:Uncharacterized protein n=1 Tax=Hibiscus sabdariffa TaxID=183260 RepID=A0ABR2FQE9_9ROSI
MALALQEKREKWRKVERGLQKRFLEIFKRLQAFIVASCRFIPLIAKRLTSEDCAPLLEKLKLDCKDGRQESFLML